MDFKKTEEQELLLESLREVVRRDGTEEYIRVCEEAGASPVKLIQALHDNGFDMLGVPEEYGGTPCDTLTLMMYHEELARICSGAYAVECTALAMDDMASFGSDAQIADCVKSIENLRTPFCLGFTEPQAGSDNSAIASSFVRDNGKIIINGRKTFITRANNSDHMLCMTKDPSASNPARAFTTWWVPMDTPGITVKPIPKFGWHMLKSCEVSLENVVVDEGAMVGKEGYGFINVMKNFEIERLVMCATALGEATMAFEDAVVYANERVQFGKPIGSFQLIQEKLLTMKMKVENMQNALYKAAWSKDQGLPVNTMVAITKYYCTQASSEVINDAIQIFGGLGYSSEMRLGRLWRNNRVCGIGGGTQEIMVHVGGRALVKEYKGYQAL